MIIIPQVHVHLLTHQIVYAKYSQFLYISYISIELKKILSLKVQSFIIIHCFNYFFIIRNHVGF